MNNSILIAKGLGKLRAAQSFGLSSEESKQNVVDAIILIASGLHGDKHTHRAIDQAFKKSDACALCNLDLRDEIHSRVGDAS